MSREKFVLFAFCNHFWHFSQTKPMKEKIMKTTLQDEQRGLPLHPGKTNPSLIACVVGRTNPSTACIRRWQNEPGPCPCAVGKANPSLPLHAAGKTNPSGRP